MFLWLVTRSGHASALTPGAPALSGSDWSPSDRSVEARSGPGQFRLQSERVGINGSWSRKAWPTRTVSSLT